MRSLFEHNISSIGGYIGNVEEKRKDWKERCSQIENIYEKEGQLYLKKENWDYRLNSVDTANEVHFLTDKIDLKKDNLLLVFGMSNYQMLEFLVKERLIPLSLILLITLFKNNSTIL